MTHMVLEAIGWQATAPSTGAAASAFGGDSLTIKSFAPGGRCRLLALWASQQSAGWQQLVWPSGHDTTRGLRLRVAGSSRWPLLPLGVGPELRSGESVVVTISGSSSAGDIEQGFALLGYDDLPGFKVDFLGAAEVRARIEKVVAVECTLALGTVGGWSGAEAINAESDLLLAGRDYAWLGISSGVGAGAIGMRAPDWGGLRLAMPGGTEVQSLAVRWWLVLAEALGEACVPVFRSDNRANVLVDGSTDENGTDWAGSVILGLLR